MVKKKTQKIIFGLIILVIGFLVLNSVFDLNIFPFSILPQIPANFEKSLLMGDLENIDLSGLTNTPVGSDFFVFEVYTYPSFQRSGENAFPSNKTKLGYSWFTKDGELFIDEDISEKLPVTFRFLDFIFEVMEGDFVTLTYDGGKTIDVYLPAGSKLPFHLYVAKDGSTYYDPEFTDLAKASPSQLPQKINVYRLENNQCTLINILESERTNLDYDTLAECQENILPPTCTEQEIKLFECPDGTKVDWCICENNDWNCILSPENQCVEPQKDLTILLVIVGIVLLILIGRKFLK